MASASIVIEILAKTASFETDTGRAARALTKFRKEAKDASTAIASEFAKVQDAIKKVGMTANQQKLLDLQNLGATQQQLKAYGRNLDELDRKTKQFASSNKALSSSFAGFAGVVGVGAAFTTISNLSDSYTKFSAQLKNSTRDATEFGQAYENVQRIASTSQADVEAIGTVYARLGNATKDLGVNQSQLSDVVETLSLALKANGASAAEASSTLLQLSQAFGKGKLDGDEFRTAMEAAPNVMRALAASMGVPFGALKDLAAEGKITAEVMLKAFSDPKLLESLREQAKQLNTISGGYVQIRNELGLLVGETNNATGATSLYAKTLSGVAALLREIRKGGGFDAGLAQLIPGGQAFSVFNQAGRRGSNASQSASGQIKLQKQPVVTPALEFEALTKNLKLLSVELAKIKAQEDEVTKSFNAGKINASQYKEIMAALAKEKESLTAKTKSSSRAIKEEDTALKEFAKQQQEIANLIQKAQTAASPSQSATESLQAELDAYTRLAPAVRDYVQSLIIAAKAKEQFAEMDKLMEEAHERELEALIESQDQQVEFQGSIEDYIKGLQRAVDPTIELADNIGKLQSALSLGLIDQEELDILTKHLEDLAKENDKTTDEITEFWKEAARNMQDAMSSFFFDAMQGNLYDLGTSFKRTIDKMVADLLASQLSDFLFGGDFGKSGQLGGLAGDLFGGLGDFFGGLFNANGNAFNQHGVMAFANGGVVNTPTPFTFGGGSRGVMGEAGPEAILPLKRGSNGQLGVQIQGGGASIVMNIQTPDANSFRKSQPQIMADAQRSLNRGRRVV